MLQLTENLPQKQLQGAPNQRGRVLSTTFNFTAADVLHYFVILSMW